MNRDRMKQTIAPALGVIAVALVAAVIGYLTANTRGERSPSPPAEESQTQQIGGEVRSINSDNLTLLVDGTEKTYKLAPGTRIETLQAAALGDIRPGDWVNGGGISHPQTLYALAGFVVIKPVDLGAPR